MARSPVDTLTAVRAVRGPDMSPASAVVPPPEPQWAPPLPMPVYNPPIPGPLPKPVVEPTHTAPSKGVCSPGGVCVCPSPGA
jgi:hypothetical protein